MASPSTVTFLDDPLTVAVGAEERLWDIRGGRPAGSIADRNAAVRHAVAAGYSADDVARALGIRPCDVNRMLEQ